MLIPNPHFLYGIFIEQRRWINLWLSWPPNRIWQKEIERRLDAYEDHLRRLIEVREVVR
jgi:hypothetical protein